MWDSCACIIPALLCLNPGLWFDWKMTSTSGPFGGFSSDEYPVTDRDERIIDAGANCGFFTLYATMRSRAQLVSIEPFRPTFGRLRENTAPVANRVTLIHAALQGHDGITYIDARSNIASQFRRIVENEGDPVNAISLDSLLRQCGWDRVDLLKMDIEGSEFDAILRASPEVLSRIGRISMEFHPRDGYAPDAIIEHLRNNGFQLTSLRDDGDGYGVAHFTNHGYGSRGYAKALTAADSAPQVAGRV